MKIRGQITYTRIQQIGVGQGMNSKVWLVHDPQLGGNFVVKEIPKAKLGNDPSKFWQESQAMNKVAHPNVVPVRAAFQTQNLICVGMDYYKNGSLADKTLKGPLTVCETLKIAHAILDGVFSIHSAGYIHFDIKPSNIFFDDKGIPLIADLGQTKEIVNNGIASTPAMYKFTMPPECFAGVGLPQSDVFQVGLTLYRCVNGDQHFKSQLTRNGAQLSDRALQQAIVSGKLPSRTDFLPHVQKSMRTIVRRALKISPQDRFASATEMTDALARVQVTHNWHVSKMSPSEIIWNSKPTGKSEIEVSLTERQNQWKVEFHSIGNTGRRKRTVAEWQSFSNKSAAFKYLNSWFARQE